MVMMNAALRHVKEPTTSVLHALKSHCSEALQWAWAQKDADDQLAAEEFDRSRGMHMTRAERSKRAYELAEGAPVVFHRGPGLLAVRD